MGTEGAPMTGPEHYQQAERLLEHAGRMLAEHVGDEGLAEPLQRQAVAVAMASAHATLADAAATGLSAHLDPLDTQAWRRAAGTPLPGLTRGRRVVPGLIPRRGPAPLRAALDDAMARPAGLRLPRRGPGALPPGERGGGGLRC